MATAGVLIVGIFGSWASALLTASLSRSSPREDMAAARGLAGASGSPYLPIRPVLGALPAGFLTWVPMSSRGMPPSTGPGRDRLAPAAGTGSRGASKRPPACLPVLTCSRKHVPPRVGDSLCYSGC